MEADYRIKKRGMFFGVQRDRPSDAPRTAMGCLELSVIGVSIASAV